MCEPRDIDQIINMLEVAFPNFHPKDVRLTKEIYWQTLGDIPTEELKAAVLHCMTESRRAFAPTIGEIRGAVAELRSYAANMPSAYEAWEDLLKAGNGWQYATGANPDGSIWIEKHPYRFRHPLVEEVARRFGWPDRFPSGDDEMADRAHFFKAYESAMSKAARAETQIPAVTAYIEDERAALDTGEAAEIMNQYRRLASWMKR